MTIVPSFSVSFSFPVSFTRGLWAVHNPLFADTIRRLEPDRTHRVLIAVDANVLAATPVLVEQIRTYFAAYARHLALAGEVVPVPGGEPSKNDLQHVLPLLGQINDTGLDRQSFITAVGGGAVLDVVSFAAAIGHRGVRTVRVPTTVLSQADSGVAVKNSINVFGKKNFAGTFVPPFAVLNDFDFLDTLDRRDRMAGLSEAVKVALLRDPDFFRYIEDHAPAASDGEHRVLERVVERSAELHLAHICGSGDPFEFGSARPLDFGHWAAHKLESMTAHRLRHGEAVAIGMALDVLYSVRLGYLARAEADRILLLLEGLGLRLWDEALMYRDSEGTLAVLAGIREFREHLGGELHVTMLRAIGQGFETTSIDETAMTEAVMELASRATRVRSAAPRAAGID